MGKPCPPRVLPRGAVPATPRSAVPQHLPGEHRHPELHGPPRPRRLPRDDRGHPARQPAAAGLRPGLSGALRIGLRARRQGRRGVHPAAQGQGGRALPGRRRLPAARDRGRQRQARRHRRLRSRQPHRGILPAHQGSSGRGLRGAGRGRWHAALRHPGLSHAARSARPGDRADRGAGHPDPHRRQGRESRAVPQGLRRGLHRPGHPDLAHAADRRRAPALRARRHRLPARRARRREGAGGPARGRDRRRQRGHRRRADGAAPGRQPGRPGLAREAPRDAGQPQRDRRRGGRGRAAAPGLGPLAHRGRRRRRLPVLRERQGREREVQPELRQRASAETRGRPCAAGDRAGHRPRHPRRQRGREHARLRRRRPEDQDDQGAWRLCRRRCAAWPAHGGRGDPLGQDRRGVDRRLAARRAAGRDHRHAGAPRRCGALAHRRAGSHAPGPRHDAGEERRGGARLGQLRPH